MRRHTFLTGLAITLALLLPKAAAPVGAQDLTITNVRIIGPDAAVVERGTIVVRGGRIVSTGAAAPATVIGQAIDAKGLSAMPGFIDAHRHFNTGPNEKAQMQAQLEAGYTTLLSGGGPAEGNITLRDRIESGQINGPRIIPSAALRLAQHTPGVVANDNLPRFRDGKPWPESIVNGVRLGEEAGYMPVNARTVWDAGAILGYCTDTTYDPLAGLEHELKSFNMMFVKAKVVIKGGKVVVDKRAK